MSNWPPTLPATIWALGFSWRKRAHLRRFLHPVEPRFVESPQALPDGATVAVWASGPFGTATHDPAWTRRVQRVFVEDGFLRSVGLGADLVRPFSWVFDTRGIHYDASRPSDLEHLLQHHEFEAPVLERAARLRARLVDTGLSKYNLGGRRWEPPALARGRPIVLVPGQVESDAAFRAQSAAVRSNLELLQAARRAEPDAWLLYKPHPDVVVGLRRSGGTAQADAPGWCDEIVSDVDTAQLLHQVQAVHVLSTLTGFEALLRGCRVVCHGTPFYAGWGLTEDHVPLPQRSRPLSLDALVAGALILYPRYAGVIDGAPCTVEEAVSALAQQAKARHGTAPAWRRWMRPLLRRD